MKALYLEWLTEWGKEYLAKLKNLFATKSKAEELEARIEALEQANNNAE